jgi:glycosyltransferase involved in cell wall biosynthesis
MLHDSVLPFFTIICPNYKTEPFLEQCLLSVKNQTFQDFECILLDDGSPGVALPITDEITNSSSDYWFRGDFENQFFPPNTLELTRQSEHIFNKITNGDKRFSFFKHNNIGQGPTRNKGIFESKGQRVVFLDCDDFLHPEYLHNAFKILSKIDKNNGEIFYTGIQNYQEGVVTTFEKNQKYVAKNNNLATIFTFPTWVLGPVNYFWRLDILKKHNVQYPGGRGEDLKIFLNALMAYQKEFGYEVATKFTHIGNDDYFYRLFPFQNYRAPLFEEELYEETTKFVRKNLPNYDIFGLRIAILCRLFIVRFRLYRKKLQAKFWFNRLFFTAISRFLTIFSILISGFIKK